MLSFTSTLMLRGTCTATFGGGHCRFKERLKRIINKQLLIGQCKSHGSLSVSKAEGSPKKRGSKKGRLEVFGLSLHSLPGRRLKGMSLNFEDGRINVKV